MELLKNYLIGLSEDNRRNILYDRVKKKYYEVTWLKEEGKYIHGGNGVVYKAIESETQEEFVVKFCKYTFEEGRNDKYIRKRYRRFEREIEALQIAADKELENVVEIIFEGDIEVNNQTIRFYVMHKCEKNLKEFLFNATDSITNSQKILLCSKILNGFKNLHANWLYHRDVKHENIFIDSNEPYVGDLGLVENRNSDFMINELGELIGPVGWFSPEAITKHYVEKNNTNNLDCILNGKSDLFQLGKLFWYIFQGNLPVGQILFEDFIVEDEELFNLIFAMLQHSKQRRPDINTVENRLKSLFPKYHL